MLKDNVLETIILILFMSITQASCSGACINLLFTYMFLCNKGLPGDDLIIF